MRIWSEELLPRLCTKHLVASWREGLGAYAIITKNLQGYRNHPAVKEWVGWESDLWNLLYRTRQEMLNRGYNPKSLPRKRRNHSRGHRKEYQTIKEQIQVLKSKGCGCRV